MKHLMEKLEQLLEKGGIKKGRHVPCDLRHCGHLQLAAMGAAAL